MNVASMALGALMKQSGVESIADMVANAKSEGSTTSTVNSVTNPLVSALQSEKMLAKTDMNSNETIDKIEENMDADNSSADDNEADEENMDTSEKEDGSDMSYKEQQFMEDYINSQAIAENSYDDPARKFKCHRCRLAFTKQNYLTAHNKTLMHRRGEKMSYPMEKYLDPNRPFKCDVCKESFTQKNILLVHYNSVSHLHKLKQITQGSPTSEMVESEPTNTSTPPTVNGESDNSTKPFKCNICKVAYSQGINLDNHIRSVCHQTKASKLQELVLTGQVDIMQPLIEQPNETQISQQQKLLSEMLVQQSAAFNPMLFPGMPGFADFGQFPMTHGLPLLLPKSIPETVTTSSTSTKSTTSVKSEKSDSKSEQDDMNGLHMLAQAANNDIVKKEMAELVKDSPGVVGPTYLCQLCNAVFTNQDSLQQHQVLCMYQMGCMAGPSPSPSAQFKQRPLMGVGRVKPQVHRNLLENIGFECVMQFNEFNNQPTSSREEAMDSSDNDTEGKVEIKEEKDTETDKKEDMPELNKGVCPTCKKEFSSVWVLKAHQEEVHKEVVPTTFVEDFGEQFINDMDLKQAKEAESLAAAAMSEAQSALASSSSESSGKAKDMPPPPPPPPLMGPQMDMSQMLPMFNLGMPLPVPLNMAMMNMQPQLMPMMFPVSAPEGMTMPSSVGDASMQNTSSKMSSAQAAAAAAMQNQNKRARTRINDEQLKVLRGYFDINNSPSEEQIIAMSEQSGLPTKVIKHWFRNTLFKERQRNKDSPYNFNNPPMTTLDLEEYEKTGKIPSSELGDIPIKKEMEDERVKDMEERNTKETMPTPKDIKPIAPMSLPLAAPPVKQEPMQLKAESPKSQESLMDDSDSMSNCSSVPPVTPRSDPPPLININLSGSSLGFNTNTDEIRPRFEFSPHHSAYNKRANRTRFTDCQIKVLQDYFEQNAYPKDDELDHLSKVLNLSPRVIVVWFQNARQKARKIYENQPNSEASTPKESTNSPLNRLVGLNYQCKKCTAVFQRYYDLIRHQKKHCNVDPDRSQSASAMNDDDNNSNDSFSSMSKDELNQSEDGSLNSYETSEHESMLPSTGIKFKCEKCNMSFDQLEAWREHQSIHQSSHMNSLFSGLSSSSAFNVLQNMAAASQQEPDKLKRKFDDDDDDQPRDKRLRTTILPEQLDYLYQKYQLDCNPSRKQLETISRDVNLKKRVVQVWFQNTRARERKGQYRAHQQLIHKRCPFCRALFRAKSALESHLATKHPEEMAKGDINVDNIPDAALESPSESLSGPLSSNLTSTPTSADFSKLTSSSMEFNKLHMSTPTDFSKMMPTSADFSKMMSPQNMNSFLPIIPSPAGIPGLPTDPLQLSMSKYYSESFKKYMTDLSTSESRMEEKAHVPLPSPVKTHESRPKQKSNTEDEAPLDLSKPLKVKVEHEKTSEGPYTDRSESSNENLNSSRHFDDSSSDVSLNKSDYMNSSQHIASTSGPNSPSVSSHNSIPGNQGNKRYRTQMTSLQVRIMKTIFVDYKTPTMAECEMLGRIIGLQKRVVQVWFQNARAKEKKAKLQMTKSYGTSPDLDFHKPPEECKLCNFKYSHKYTIQDHIFTKKHIENVRSYVQSQSEAESHLSSQGMAGLTGSLNKPSSDRKWEDQSSQSHLAQLQSMGMGLPMGGLSGKYDISFFL